MKTISERIEAKSDKRQYLCIIVPPHGEIQMESHVKKPDLAQLQKYVQGSIQELPYFKKMTLDGVEYTRGIAYANENGWSEAREYNERAKAYWMKACPEGEPGRMTVLGTIVFMCLEPKNVTKS